MTTQPDLWIEAAVHAKRTGRLELFAELVPPQVHDFFREAKIHRGRPTERNQDGDTLYSVRCADALDCYESLKPKIGKNAAIPHNKFRARPSPLA